MHMLSDFKLKTDAIAAEHQRHCCMRSRSCAWVGFCLLSKLSIASASPCIEQTGKSHRHKSWQALKDSQLRLAGLTSQYPLAVENLLALLKPLQASIVSHDSCDKWVGIPN